MIRLLILAASLLAYGWGSSSLAQEIPQGLISKVEKIIPGIERRQITPSPLEGIFEVSLGMDIYYIDREGKYLFKGDLIELDSARNVTELRRGSSRLQAINRLDEKSMIVFSPKEPKYKVTVFTDVDCPYCRRLHSEVGELNKNGIAVRYLAFPRTGINSAGYDKMVSVWCSENPKKAMTDAKTGKKVAPKSCDNPVDEHFDLGQKFSIRGTPTIILENGEVIGGYLPAKRLISKVQAVETTQK